VLVGTPAYHDPELADVAAAAANVNDLAAVLTDPRLGGFDPAHCARAPWDAGIAQVGALLVKAAEEAEDLLLFYYSGHGLLSALRRELYLSLAGTRRDQLAFTALPFDAVRDAWLESRAASRVVILDCCFSGRAIGQSLAADDDALLVQIKVSGTYTMTSAPGNRTALVLPGETNTAFTGRLLGLLRTGIAGAGPVLSLGDIYKRLYAQLSSEGLPLPQQQGTETADLIGLVRNRLALRPPPAADREPAVPPGASPPILPDAGTSDSAKQLAATLVDTEPLHQAGPVEQVATPRVPAAPPALPGAARRPQPRRPTQAGVLLALAAAVSVAFDVTFWLHLGSSPRLADVLAAVTAALVFILLTAGLVALRPRRADRQGRSLEFLPAILGCYLGALLAAGSVVFAVSGRSEAPAVVILIAGVVFLVASALVLIGFDTAAVAGSRMKVWNRTVREAVRFVPVVGVADLFLDQWVPSPLLAVCLGSAAWMVLRWARSQRAA